MQLEKHLSVIGRWHCRGKQKDSQADNKVILEGGRREKDEPNIGECIYG
jgi:hypothetical protein